MKKSKTDNISDVDLTSHTNVSDTINGTSSHVSSAPLSSQSLVIFSEDGEIGSKILNDYISTGQKDLIHAGAHLLTHVRENKTVGFSDFSFLVFPFAKAYEGFLKQVFLDAHFINQEEYVSKFFRVGKVMSPFLVERIGKKSVYQKICLRVGCDIGDEIWAVWTTCRNEVFHYFPHNVRSLTLDEAEQCIHSILDVMRKTVVQLKLTKEEV